MNRQNHNNSEQSANNQSNGSSLQNSNYETPNTDSQSPGRSTDDSDYYKIFLEQLLDLVCNEDQETVARLVSVIRSGASHQDILAAISQVQSVNSHVEENGNMAPSDQEEHGGS
ncbi:hypothetical protein BDV25DRAFT_143822 [Aspergillus avenaceus]|uniref:Uncharacterized protein n=1 Tax=Aspergillus avenaceus TaxID=36643 RepID=A0A5N6TJR1_ASPAV|nr:hypothetical protein BDV25DRAFT_143822 [Aspergillus avenaceus]